MTAETDFLKRVRDTLRADTRIGLDEASIVLALSDGALLVDGEVADVAVKRRSLRDGRPWGSAASDECRIDSIAQSWAVLAGAGLSKRSQTAVEAAAIRNSCAMTTG